MSLDFFNIEQLIPVEERMMRETARRFADEQVRPIIEAHFEAHTFPAALVKKMGELGFLGPFVPEDYGGINASYLGYGLICQELECGDSGVRSFCSVQSSLVMYPLWKFGSEEQRRHYLPRLAQGELIGCFGLTEPDFGSNPTGMQSTAKKDGKSYLLNGTKRWITNADIADVSLVWAKDETGRVAAYLIDKGTPGLTQVEIKRKFSLRASHTGELILENCRIPLENKLPNTEGLKSALQCLDSARFGIVWGALGAAIACYDTALGYAKERVQFSRPIAGYQLVQAKLVQMLSEITKGQLLALRLAQLRDAQMHSHQQTSLCKMNNVRIALDIARQARDILGASGITSEYPVIRHMLNLESVNTYEGTEDIHRLILGKAITGLDAFE